MKPTFQTNSINTGTVQNEIRSKTNDVSNFLREAPPPKVAPLLRILEIPVWSLGPEKVSSWLSLVHAGKSWGTDYENFHVLHNFAIRSHPTFYAIIMYAVKKQEMLEI